MRESSAGGPSNEAEWSAPIPEAAQLSAELEGGDPSDYGSSGQLRADDSERTHAVARATQRQEQRVSAARKALGEATNIGEGSRDGALDDLISAKGDLESAQMTYGRAHDEGRLTFAGEEFRPSLAPRKMSVGVESEPVAPEQALWEVMRDEQAAAEDNADRRSLMLETVAVPPEAADSEVPTHRDEQADHNRAARVMDSMRAGGLMYDMQHIDGRQAELRKILKGQLRGQGEALDPAVLKALAGLPFAQEAEERRQGGDVDGYEAAMKAMRKRLGDVEVSLWGDMSADDLAKMARRRRDPRRMVNEALGRAFDRGSSE